MYYYNNKWYVLFVCCLQELGYSSCGSSNMTGRAASFIIIIRNGACLNCFTLLCFSSDVSLNEGACVLRLAVVGFLQLCLLVRIISDKPEHRAAGVVQNILTNKQSSLRFCENGNNVFAALFGYQSNILFISAVAYVSEALKNFLLGNIRCNY